MTLGTCPHLGKEGDSFQALTTSNLEQETPLLYARVLQGLWHSSGAGRRSWSHSKGASSRHRPHHSAGFVFGFPGGTQSKIPRGCPAPQGPLPQGRAPRLPASPQASRRMRNPQKCSQGESSRTHGCQKGAATGLLLSLGPSPSLEAPS